MARVTVEDCLDNVENRFELVLVAAKRAHQLNSGHKSILGHTKDKPTVLALREIEAGIIDASILSQDYDLQENMQKDGSTSEKIMQEINKELSETSLDRDVDDIYIEEK